MTSPQGAGTAALRTVASPQGAGTARQGSLTVSGRSAVRRDSDRAGEQIDDRWVLHDLRDQGGEGNMICEPVKSCGTEWN